MSNPTNVAVTVEPGSVAIAAIVGLTGTGRNATDTRNLLVVRELLLGVPQASIVTATEAAGDKLDKGTVSRLNKLGSSLKPAQKKLIMSFAPESINPADATTWAEAIKVMGTIRPGKLQTGTKERAPKEELDIHAAYFDYVFEDGIFHEDRWSLMVAAVETFNAELAAEAASEGAQVAA